MKVVRNFDPSHIYLLREITSSNFGTPNYKHLCRKLSSSKYKNEFDYFSTLPVEILYIIFETSSLRDQLVIARVSRLFEQIIRNILQRKFKDFNYNYLTFEHSHYLMDSEISQLCYLCGKTLERIRFNTNCDLDLYRNIRWCPNVVPLENVKYFINDNFKQNVKYFKDLQELEVQGKFLQDKVILELAKHCKKLKTIRLLDGGDRYLLGEHLPDLKNIENLELKFCHSLDPNHLLATSQKRKLKTLNIVECEYIKYIPKILKLCKNWHYLETLRLTAFSQDSIFLKAIIDLPNLKTVQFYWTNFMSLNFEEDFFLELQKHKKKSLLLKHVKFENDPYYIEDESLQQWTPEKYAIMRENVCINDQSWQWSVEVFKKISLVFGKFKNLVTLSFYYCRLLDYDQLKQLSLIIPNLEIIKIYGCPKLGDEEFQKQWIDDEQNCGHTCQLSFKSVLPLRKVMSLYTDANWGQFPSSYRREPVFRSIECQFC